jgi:formate hydrogenlyase subunit 3/multisubunit Na+/H+ antiporter MnhD subunit
MLSGIFIETGLYAMIRVLFILFQPSFFVLPIALLAAVTMTLGNFMALLQEDLKRLLAYSSIAQIGYMLIGVSAGTAYGIMGVFLHVFNHSLLKGMAFLSAGSIVHEAETRNIDSLKGIGRFMPVTSLCLFITLLGLGGVPGTNGFISKFILFNSAIGEGMAWLAVLGVLNSALSMGYYLRVMNTLLSEPAESLKGLKEAPPMMLGVTVVMAFLIVLFGLWPEPVIGYASAAAEALIDNLPRYIWRIMS